MAQTVRALDGTWNLEFDSFHKLRLLAGLDDIGATPAHAPQIRAFEAGRLEQRSWLSALRNRLARGTGGPRGPAAI